MRFRATFVLMLAVLAVGGGIWYLEREVEGTDAREARARQALDVDPDEVRFLRIETTNLVASCRLVGSQWRIESPLKTYADRGEIRRILTGLNNLPKGEVITADQRRERSLRLYDYGLETPRARITLHQGDQERELLVGAESAVGDSLYVMEAGGEDVVATSRTLLELLPDNLERLRSRKLIPDPPYVLRRLEIRRASGFLLLANDARRGWFLQQPVETRAHNAFVRDLINKLSTAEISRFVEDGVTGFAPYGLDDSAVHVSLWPVGGGPARTLQLGSPDPSDPELVFARVDDGNSVFGVSRQLYTDLMLDAKVFRDRHLLDVVPPRIAYIRVTEGERTLELVKDDAGSWSLTRPRKRAADSTRVWDLLTEWSESRILNFVSDTATNRAEFGLSDPTQTILLSVRPPAPETDDPDVTPPSEEGVSQVTLLLFEDTGDRTRLYAQQADSKVLVTTPAEVFPLLAAHPLRLYDRTVLQLVLGDIRKIELQDGDRHQIVQTDKAGVFRPGAGQGGEAILPTIEAMLAEVSGLRAVRFVDDDPEDLEAYGLAAPGATLTFGLTGDAGISKTLMFGGPADPDGRFATIRGQGTVFILSPDTCERLLPDLVDVPATATEDSLAPPVETP